MGGAFAGWVLDSLSSGVVAIDAGGAVVALNAGAAALLGLAPDAPATALGRPCRELLAHQPTAARLLQDAVDGCGSLSRAELVLEPAGGGRGTTVGFTLCPVRDREGRPRGAAMLFRDLTPFERQDEQARLADRLKALGQMAADLAHEIRNPLAGMEVSAGLLRRMVAERRDERELVDELLGELRKVAATVAASLDFVRPVALSRESVDLESIVEEALTLARLRAPFEGEVLRGFEPGLPRPLADPEQLRAVVENLIANAFEAMDGDGRLILTLERRDLERGDVLRVGEGVPARERGPLREIVLGVADTGPGVPDELRERIFYPFFTTRERGSGVGLAVAQKIAASHGGRIELTSKAGQGAAFRVHLPLDPEWTGAA